MRKYFPTLRSSGYETDICHTGKDGLFLAGSTPYDAIVLDRMLPEMDGLSVLEYLRRKNIRIPVILATALDGLTDRIDGLDAGGGACFTVTLPVRNCSPA